MFSSGYVITRKILRKWREFREEQQKKIRGPEVDNEGRLKELNAA